MNACMGKDLTGEIAKSQAFLVFKSSYEFTTAPASAAAVILVFAEDEDDEDFPAAAAAPLDAFPYNDDNKYNKIHSVFSFGAYRNNNIYHSPLGVMLIARRRPIRSLLYRIVLHTLKWNLPLTRRRQNLAEEEA